MTASLPRRALVVLGLCLGVPGASPGAEPPRALRVPGELSPRNASYRMNARLDDVTHTVTGHEVLSWRNRERRPADKLVFHLYLNAFKNHASTFIREAGTQLRGDEMPAHGYGAIDVTALRIGKRDLLKSAVIDDTLMTVPLPEPVGPGAAVEVEIAWTAALPKIFARSGYAGPFHAVAQWFPKVGVWDCPDDNPESKDGGCRWRAHQYHGNTEFFSDYGVYDVELDVPAKMEVGATGVLLSERRQGDRRVLTYHAEDVHDFVWMADTRFIEVNDRVDDQWGSVAVRLLTRAGQEDVTPRHLRAVREGLLELERRLGVYPYGNVTVVIPPGDGEGAGGMEYPTLFTSVSAATPSGVRLAEYVTVHELGHQFFYGILGTDEVEEAWMDEGLNETFTTWAMERLFGPRCDLIDVPGLCVPAQDLEWLGYRRTTRRAPVATPAYLFPPGTYGAVTYAQTAVSVRTLEGYLGPARLEAGMRRYANRFRFLHPRRADFVAAFDEGAGEDLRWFWDQALGSARVADFQVLCAETTPHLPAAGLWDCPPRPITTTDPEARELIKESQEAACAGQPPGRHEFDPGKDPRFTHPKLHDSEVWVQRRGDFLFPVDVRMTFEDGSQVRERWSLGQQQAAGEERTRRYRYLRRPSPLQRVEIDPDKVVTLDERRLNNGWLMKPDAGPAQHLWTRWHGVVQTLIELLGP